MSGRGFIAVEPPQTCQHCGKETKCRPYGANGEQICWDCAQLDPATTERQMYRYLFGEDTPA